MQLSKQEERRYVTRLLNSRLRLLCTQGFYGTLLMHISFVLDENVKNISVNKKKIYINPSFLDSINDTELDFILMHEVTHLALRHNFKRRLYDNSEIFDRASDIIVNSNILRSFNMDQSRICINEKQQEHMSPENEEGYKYNVEDLYKLMLNYDFNNSIKNRQLKKDKYKDGYHDFNQEESNGFDDHSKWNKDVNEQDELEWQKIVLDTCQTLYIRDPSNTRGTIPGFAQREFEELKQAKTDWRTLLNNFIQDEINDYSFTPPDKRYDESDFFLPDYNDTDEVVKGILFMVDTSGSMSDEQITQCYSEIKGAIDQFSGKLQGWLGFFDAAIIEPKEFTNEDELKIIRPYGGGGTDFDIIFNYANDHMEDKNISSIVVLTDGYAPWPNEDITSIPTIWLINNNESNPPWGVVARIINDNKYKN